MNKIDMPSMDKKGLALFISTISKKRCLLEYGCGGSTVYSVNLSGIDSLISIDTSKDWIDKVRNSIKPHERLHFIHCNVGEVGSWGKPKSRELSENFWKYIVDPWKKASLENLSPDVVLVDGRFRVASFLYSILCAIPETPILFDDYFLRPSYFVVEQFIKPAERHGRMALFYAQKPENIVSLVSVLCEYINVWE